MTTNNIINYISYNRYTSTVDNEFDGLWITLMGSSLYYLFLLNEVIQTVRIFRRKWFQPLTFDKYVKIIKHMYI